MSKRGEVMNVYAPPPRPTFWAALLVATGASAMFLATLGLWQLLA